MLEVKNLQVVYGNGNEALKSVSLKVERGEIIAVIGRSGAGKSTLLRCINGLQNATSGEVILDNENITGMGQKQLRLARRKMYGLGEVDKSFFDWRRAHPCVIGHDTWLGHNVVIMPGVTIGTGAVIGSGAVVTKDVDPYTFAVGVPAKPIRKRFPDVTIEKLLRIAWWDWDRATLEARFDDLYNIEQFVEKYGC